jgi:hypothetical protein
MSSDNYPEFVGLKIFKQQTYPGIESDLWYTMNYRVEFDLKTNGKTTFTYLIVNQDSIPINLVMAGRYAQKEDGGKSLFEDTEKASASTEVFVYQNDDDVKKKNHSPKSSAKISLAYTYKEQNYNVLINEIIVEETIAHP